MVVAETDVLVVVDVQNDFLCHGALAVPDGDAVIAHINDLATRFRHVVLTQDWHPAEHISFASSHPGHAAFEVVTLADGRQQVLWPEHCRQGSPGAALASALAVPHAELIIRKGTKVGLDSYSAFIEADGATPTGLAGYLRERGLTRVFVVGLATDFCAGWTAVDAARSGFSAVLVEDCTRGIDHAGSMGRAVSDMAAAGVVRIVALDVSPPNA